MVTYTVQQQDTLSDIANRLSAEVDEIQSVNKALIQKPGSINSGWVLFIPMYKNGLPELTSQTLKKGFDTERPLVYDLDEIAEATNNFDDTRIIGECGYGSVYFGILGEKEVAIKKMRSNKSKEFLAELKVLCKIHHINVVELLGFASRDDHLYLVYEFVSNGSLNEHHHDPLLKGHQPLPWTARAQIVLDAAKGTKELHVTTKTDVFAFGVVLAKRITRKRALMRDNQEPSKMKSLITIITKVFEEEEGPEGVLASVRDGSLRDGYPMDDLYKVNLITLNCTSTLYRKRLSLSINQEERTN
ncbi:LysM domain receptor-like kinase 3 [Tanacetum coccineum]